MAAAEPLRITYAEDARRTGLEVQLTGKFLGLLPVVDMRQDLTLDKASYRVADQLVGGVEVFLTSRHRGFPLRFQENYQALAWLTSHG
jgi:hypothetical protein